MKSFDVERVLLVVNTFLLALSLSSYLVYLHAHHVLSWGGAMARRLIEARVLGPGEDLSDESPSSSSSSDDDEDEEALAKRRQAIIAKMQAAQTASERASEQSKPVAQLPSPNPVSAQAKDLHSAPALDTAPAIPAPKEKDTSSSDDDDFAAPKLIFVSKAKRADRQTASFTETTTSSTSNSTGRSHEQRAEESRTMVRDASIALQEAEADTATTDDMEMPDDTDGLDPTAEYEAWKLREQRRISLFAAVS